MKNKPSILVLLGDVITIDMGDHEWQFKTNESWMTATPYGNELWIIPKFSHLPKADKKSSMGQSLFRLFKGWKADKNYTYNLPSFKLVSLGKAVSISYRSDKWDRKSKGYIHDFDTPANLTGNNKTNPTIFKLTGKFLITSRGIEG